MRRVVRCISVGPGTGIPNLKMLDERNGAYNGTLVLPLADSLLALGTGAGGGRSTKKKQKDPEQNRRLARMRQRERKALPDTSRRDAKSASRRLHMSWLEATTHKDSRVFTLTRKARTTEKSRWKPLPHEHSGRERHVGENFKGKGARPKRRPLVCCFWVKLAEEAGCYEGEGRCDETRAGDG